MAEMAARQDDHVKATDTHIELVPSGSGTTPKPVQHAFDGLLDGKLSSDVYIGEKLAALEGSTASNTPPHVAKEGTFQTPPSNKATIITGSATVFINGCKAARNGDTATTCNDPTDLPVGKVEANSTVFIGG